MKEGVKVQEQAAGVHIKDFKRCREVTEVMVLKRTRRVVRGVMQTLHGHLWVHSSKMIEQKARKEMKMSLSGN